MKIISVHALSLDGSIASDEVESDEQRLDYGLTSDADQNRVEALLKEADAVITGSTSLVSADKAWDVKNKKGKNVEWVVLTNKGLPENIGFWDQKHIERTLVSSSDLPESNTSKIESSKTLNALKYGTENPAETIIKYLQAKNAQTILLFGGSKVNKIFFEKNLVTHLEYTLCPVILGGSERVNLMSSGLKEPNKAKLVHTHLENDHVFLSYELNFVNSLIK